MAKAAYPSMVLSINLFAFLHNKQSLSLQAEKKPTIFNMTLDICYHTNLADLVTYELIPAVIEFGNRPESIYTSITTQICSKAARQMKENVK